MTYILHDPIYAKIHISYGFGVEGHAACLSRGSNVVPFGYDLFSA